MFSPALCVVVSKILAKNGEVLFSVHCIHSQLTRKALIAIRFDNKH